MERELANARLLQGLTDSHSNEKAGYITEIQDLKAKNDELNIKCQKITEDFELLFQKFSIGKK